ncbi:hypothetical protein M527_06370 [Sphingobium indicum IP26]|uniref:hypothetical protein n=1 Tax=Sphingobium indicum TaxID=332055 RepID=UPI000367FA92|nr:hypothetical protein [Sphingobium indicum]EPR09749.1 hypothetical protein M527_06370 [Sphingobium indicum IP26]
MMDGKVDQDVREAAAALVGFYGRQQKVDVEIRSGARDDHPLVEALSLMKEAGRQAGLREALDVIHRIGGKYASDGLKNEALREAYSAITALTESAPCPPPPASS